MESCGELERVGLAQDQITVWVRDDRAVLERLRRIIDGSDGYLSGLPVTERVRLFVLHLLFQDDGSTYRATWREFRRDLVGYESRMPGLVRETTDRPTADKIDWDALVKDITAEGM